MTPAAGRTLRGVLFDLDGTLLDTAPDLAAALNRVRAAHALPPLPYAEIRPWVSHGSYALTRLGFSFAQDSDEFEAARLALLDAYHAHVADDTRLFPGMDTLLDDIEARGLRWGAAAAVFRTVLHAGSPHCTPTTMLPHLHRQRGKVVRTAKCPGRPLAGAPFGGRLPSIPPHLVCGWGGRPKGSLLAA